MDSISPDELKIVLLSLHDADTPFKLPHGCVPLTEGPITKNDWEGPTATIRWNPAHGETGFNNPDPTASPRPSWSVLENTSRSIKAAPARMLRALDLRCTAEISDNYGVSSRMQEYQKRLAGQTTPEQDAERVRLIARCHAVEAEIATADTLEKREAILARIEDGTWADEPTTSG